MSHTLFSSETLAWLADVTLQATLVLALFGGVALVRPRMAAARKHLLLAVGLLTIPLLMLASRIMPLWQPVKATSYLQTPLPETVGVRETRWPQGETTISTAPTPHSSEVSETLSRTTMLLGLWLAGLGIGLLGIVRAAFQLRQLRHASVEVTDLRLQKMFREIQRQMAISLPDSALRQSAECGMPMTWGWKQRTILLPLNADQWSDAQLRLVLGHELAHLRRGDVLTSLLTAISALLLWFHPLVWFVRRAYLHSGEQACDDLALQYAETDPEDFATELLAAVTSLGNSPRFGLPLSLAMAMSARVQALKSRLASILDASKARAGWTSTQTVVLLLSGAVLTVGLSGLTACRNMAPLLRIKKPQITISSKFIEITAKHGSTILEDAGISPSQGAPGLHLIGNYDEAQITALLKKLSARKGVDLMSAPAVTTLDRQKAQVEVVREFIYPTEYDPPSLPDFKEGKPIRLAPGQSIAVTPTTPTAFEMKPVGVRLELIPELESNNFIQLQLTPEITEFEGFNNYGSPIKATSVDTDGKMQETTLTENRVQQPIFSTIKMSTSVLLESGNSVIFGGLMRSDPGKNGVDRWIYVVVRAEVIKP